MEDNLVVKCPNCGLENRFESEEEKQEVINDQLHIRCENGIIKIGCHAVFQVLPDGMKFIEYNHSRNWRFEEK